MSKSILSLVTIVFACSVAQAQSDPAPESRAANELNSVDKDSERSYFASAEPSHVHFRANRKSNPSTMATRRTTVSGGNTVQYLDTYPPTGFPSPAQSIEEEAVDFVDPALRRRYLFGVDPDTCCDEWDGFCKCGGTKANPGHYGRKWFRGFDPCDEYEPLVKKRCHCKSDGCKTGGCQGCSR